MAIKRRAAPKLFRTRKLANGQVVQIRAGGRSKKSACTASLGTESADTVPAFFEKTSRVDNYEPPPNWRPPTFYNSADVRYGQEFAASSQWAFGSQASPAVETSRLVTHNRQGNVAAG
jgi:hypothetical protein